MFPRNPVTAVTRSGALKTTVGQTPVTSAAKVTAAIAGSGGGVNVSLAQYSNSQYSYFMSGLLPATPDMPDSTALAYFYRDIYLHDNTAGSCVDIQSIFPFSDWELRGIDDNDMEVFNTALERLNLRELLPQLSVSYLTDGFYTGSLIYDPAAKNFMDILTHDALQCGVSPSPFNNVDPTIRVSVSGPTLRFLDSSTEYAKKYVQTMPRAFVDLLREGSFVLDPITTLFVGRRALTDRAYVSYLHRILPMYLIEKTMFRGTLIEANRRQRAMTHITAGDDIWTPTGEELSMLVQQFQTAEQDPLGAWVSTRNAVQVQDVRPGGDFWKWTDMNDVMVPYKLRALGISEALLSGDSSYAAAESAYSTYLETVNGYRTHLTNAIFYKKLFPLIGIANKMFKDGKEAKKSDNVVDFLFNSNNRANLKQPVLHWHKDLTAKAEDNMMDMLDKISEKNIPIPMKMWLAAAGVDKDTLIRDAKEEDELKATLAKLMGPQTQPGAEGGEEDEFDDPSSSDTSGAGTGRGAGDKVESRLTTASMKEGLGRNRRAVLNREFPSEEMFTHSLTGKKKAVINNPRGKMVDQHHRIAKIAARAETDPNYREALRARNLQKMGMDRIPGFSGGK